ERGDAPAVAARASGARGGRRRAAWHGARLGRPRLRERRSRGRHAADTLEPARHPDQRLRVAQALSRCGAAAARPGLPRRSRDPARVDAHTLFQIASNTKAFTTAALAILADEGKLSWDDPVTKFLPGFQLYDPYVTRDFTVRDLVTHRSGLGLGAGDLLWFHSNYNRGEIAHRIRFARPVSSFRSAYAYDNVLYIVAGEMWSGQTILPIPDPPPPLAALRANFSEYALGWRLRDYQGRKIVSHTGGLAGMSSQITLVPAEKLGLVILTNSESDLMAALTY